ncbi:hypothetical protein KBT16_24045, partial [Nostoc sp. CCCryo 231-06]|nr:hypothetical protein [Nostoc sp. CCCryo 231-06]
ETGLLVAATVPHNSRKCCNGAKRLINGVQRLINVSQLAPYRAQHSKYWANSVSPLKWTAINLKKWLSPL